MKEKRREGNGIFRERKGERGRGGVDLDGRAEMVLDRHVKGGGNRAGIRRVVDS